MADIYDFVTVPTYDLTTLAVVDNSQYSGIPPLITLTIEVPGFATVEGLTFNNNTVNIYNSVTLGISSDIEPLPDGIYCISYMVDGETEPAVQKRILRVDKLQQKFDESFLYLEMMECDRAIKMQSKVDLISIYFFIQGAIASANNCATVEATKLYIQADKMLNAFIAGRYTTGNNFVINFS